VYSSCDKVPFFWQKWIFIYDKSNHQIEFENVINIPFHHIIFYQYSFHYNVKYLNLLNPHNFLVRPPCQETEWKVYGKEITNWSEVSFISFISQFITKLTCKQFSTISFHTLIFSK